MHTSLCVLIEISMEISRDVKILECDYLLEQQCLKLTLVIPGNSTILRLFKFSAGTRISGFIFASKNVERSRRM